MARYIEEDSQGNRYIVDDGVSNAPAPSYQPSQSNTIGPNHDQSYLTNAIKGPIQAFPGLWDFGKSVYSFINPWADNGQGGPIDTISRSPVAAMDWTGKMAAGTAGAATGAELGAAVGGPFAPITGIIGGGLGFGAGVLGYDTTRDVALNTQGVSLDGQGVQPIQPLSNYLKDATYNSTQAMTLAGLGKLAGNISPVKLPGTQAYADAKVVEKLNSLEPGYATKVDQALVNDAPTAATVGPENLPGATDLFNQKSLAELLNSNPLRVAQRSMSMSGGKEVAGTLDNTTARNNAQLKFLDQLEQSPATVGDAQSAIQSSLDNKSATMQSDIANAEAAVKSGVGDLPLPIDKMEAGSAIRESMQGSKDALAGKISEKFPGADAGTVDMAPVAETVAQILPKYYKDIGPQPNTDLTALVADIQKTGDTIPGVNGEPILDSSRQPIVKPYVLTLDKIQKLRSQALDIANSSDRVTASVARQLADSLLKAGDEAVKSGTVDPKAVAAWHEGIKLRKQMGVDYENIATPTKGILAKQPYGEYKIADSTVPSKVFKPKGNKEAIQNYKITAGTSDAAMEPLYRFATDSFREFAVTKDGLVDSAKASRWLRDHAAQLDEMPLLKQQLSDIHGRQQFLNEKYGDLKRTQTEVENGALKYFLQADPEAAIKATLSGNNAVKRLTAVTQYLKANSPDALAGLRRGVLDHLERTGFIPSEVGGIQEAIAGGKPFQGTVRSASLTSEIARIRPALERSGLFTKSQLKGLDYFYNDKNSQLSIDRARVGGGSDSSQNITVLGSLMNIGTRFLRGYRPTDWLLRIAEPAIKAIPESKYKTTFRNALLDPRLARDLQNKPTAKNVTKIIQELFGKDIAQAMGTTASIAPTVSIPEKKRPIAPPKQSTVLAKKSYPTPDELLRPPATGKMQGPFDAKAYAKSLVSQQGPETQARVGVESNHNPYATSPKGAQGLAQLMPSTAQDIAKALGETYMPLRAGMTPEQQKAAIDQNVRFGDYYLNTMLPKIDKSFKNKSLAWAAYNAGPGAVQDAMMMAGTTRDVNKILAQLPDETQQYVKKLTRTYGQG